MSKLEHQAEILKLARFLDCEAERLSMLADIPAADIRKLREAATRHFFATDAAFFKRIVAASRLLPVPALALVAEKVLGPLLSARVAGQMDVDRGVGIARRLETTFLADTCLSLDPNHTRDLIAAMPAERIVDVGLELSRRQEFVTMARFVDIVTEDALRAVLERLTDNAALLHIAFFVEDKARLERILEIIPESRLIAIIETAASEEDLWPEALGLMEHLGAVWRGRLGDLAASLDTHILESMVHSVRRHGLWSVALPLVGDMSQDSQRTFAMLPAVQDDAMLRDILQACDVEKVWPAMLPLLALMDDEALQRVAAATEVLDGEQMLRVADAANEHGHWREVLTLIDCMSAEQRQTMLGLIGMAPERMLLNLMPVVEEMDRWQMLRETMADIGSAPGNRLRAAAEKAGFSERLDATA